MSLTGTSGRFAPTFTHVLPRFVVRKTPTSVATKSHFGFDGWRMTSLTGACGMRLPAMSVHVLPPSLVITTCAYGSPERQPEKLAHATLALSGSTVIRVTQRPGKTGLSILCHVTSAGAAIALRVTHMRPLSVPAYTRFGSAVVVPSAVIVPKPGARGSVPSVRSVLIRSQTR